MTNMIMKDLTPSSLAWIVVTTVIIGEISFFIAGGISALATDVGVSGAWGISVFMQLLYAIMSVVGYLAFLYISKKHKSLKANKVAATLSAGIITASINLFGVFYNGASIQFIWFSIIIISLSFTAYTLSSLTYNSLTNRLSSPVKGTGGTREKVSRAP